MDVIDLWVAAFVGFSALGAVIAIYRAFTRR